MSAGQKRTSETAGLYQPLEPKRNKIQESSFGNTLELTITHVDNSSYLSFLDQTIDKFNYWLRRLFRREPYSSSNSSINDISSIQSPRDNSNNAHIVMTDEDSFGEGSSVPVASGSFRPQGRVTSILQSYFEKPTPISANYDLRPLKSTTKKNSKKTSKDKHSHVLHGSSSDTETSSCPVLTSLIRQREEAMFQELISLDIGTMSLSPSLSPHPENVGPVVSGTHVTESATKQCPTSTIPSVTLYSTTMNTTTIRPQGINVSAHQNMWTPTHTKTFSTTYRDPSVSLHTSSSLETTPVTFTTASTRHSKQLQFGHSTTTQTHAEEKKNPSASSNSVTQSPVDQHITPHTLSYETKQSNSFTSESRRWIENFKQHHGLRLADRQARLEVIEKYAKIHQEERMEADDKRAKKLIEMMDTMRVRPWTSGLDEDDMFELNFDLNDDLLLKVNEAWGYGYFDELFAEGYNMKIKRCDLATLKGFEWLNDEIINFYLNLVVESVNQSGERSVHLFNSFFYPKIMSAGYSGVRRWTKKIDLFSYDLVLLPVHLGMHWCLACIDFRNHQIQYYDSLRGNNTQCLYVLSDYLVSEAKDKKQMVYDVSDWSLECCKDIPEQHNGSDCGVFTCMYARHLARNKPFNFSQKDMPSIRKMMVAEIISKQIL